MASLTVENYLKAILQIQLKQDSKRVSPGSIAARMGVSPGSVTSMLKTLSEASLADYVPYEGVALSEAGQRLAMRVLRRHRLIELFLINTLDMTWDQVHDEAEVLEHAMSDVLVDRIDDYLGHPETDPHGAPIPAADGELRGTSSPLSLDMCDAGECVRFLQVVNQEPGFLRYLSDSGFELGAIGEVVDTSEDGGVVKVSINDLPFTVGYDAASTIRVERVSSEQPTA
jgi:DtxR family Mn-dependent transcriptional regulator